MAECCDGRGDVSKIKDNKSNSSILGLPWQDVIFSHIFYYLSLSDIVRCRRVCKTFNELCLNFFKHCNSLDFSLVTNRITEKAFTHIALETSRLKILVLENCRIVKDSMLAVILQRNPRLTHLNICGCNSLTNQCLLDVGKRCPELNQIHMRECRWVSPQGVMNLALCCQSLEVADLSGCWEVNDECLTDLAKACPNLSRLSVNGCYGITDLSLHVVCHHLPLLTTLELDGCWRVTNRAIQLIGEYCQKLQCLKVKDCRDITEVSLAKLRIKGVNINVQPMVSPSVILQDLLNRPVMHMVPILRLNPS